MQTLSSLHRFTVVGVALASAIAASFARFSFWTTVVGVTLLLVLSAYGRLPEAASALERVAYHAIQALCLALAAGWLIYLYLPTTSLSQWEFVIGGLVFRPGSADGLLFLLWLAVFVMGSVLGRGKATAAARAEQA